MSYTAVSKVANFGAGHFFAQIAGNGWTELTSESIYDYNFDPNVLQQAQSQPVTDSYALYGFVAAQIHYSTDPSVRRMVYAMYHPPTPLPAGGKTTTPGRAAKPETPAETTPPATRRRRQRV